MGHSQKLKRRKERREERKEKMQPTPYRGEVDAGSDMPLRSSHIGIPATQRTPLIIIHFFLPYFSFSSYPAHCTELVP